MTIQAAEHNSKSGDGASRPGVRIPISPPVPPVPPDPRIGRFWLVPRWYPGSKKDQGCYPRIIVSMNPGSGEGFKGGRRAFGPCSGGAIPGLERPRLAEDLPTDPGMPACRDQKAHSQRQSSAQVHIGPVPTLPVPKNVAQSIWMGKRARVPGP